MTVAAGGAALAVGSVDVAGNAIENAGSDPNISFSKSDGGGKAPKDKGSSPNSINYDQKQIGKKYGEHKKDYPDMKNYSEYKDYADEIFESPDQIIQDSRNKEFYYTKGDDLLRIKENGDFVSLYPGATSERVLDAINSGGIIWP